VKNKLVLGIIYELCWFAFASAAAYLLVLPVMSRISQEFLLYLLGSSFLVFTYFRFTAFLMRSVLLESVWIKMLFFIGNVPLFFLMLNLYFTFGRAFDDYNYTLAAGLFQHIKSGTELDDLMYIKKLVTFCGVASLMVIIVFELRIVHSIFKLRQLDKYLVRN
jgi:hypothetical protein